MSHGVPLSPLDGETVSKLRELISETGHVGNPLDLSGRVVGVPPDAIFDLVANDPTVDALLMPFTTSFPDHSPGRVWHRDYLELLANAGKSAGKPVLLVSLGSQARTAWIDELEDRYPLLAVLQGIRTTMEALAALTEGEQAATDQGTASSHSAPSVDPTFLSEAAGRELLVEAGLSVVPGVTIPQESDTTLESWHLGFPVVVKGILPGVAHKAQVGGVELGICNLSDLALACQRIREQSVVRGLTLDGFLVEEQVQGVEMLLGLVRDPHLGPAVTVGLGGALAEATMHHATAPLPAEADDVERLIDLAGLRGLFSKPQTRHGFVDYVTTIAREFTDGSLSDWATIEVNPLFLVPDGRVLAGDVLAVPFERS